MRSKHYTRLNKHGKKQPFDPFEFAEEDVDKDFRKGFVMDTGMEAGFPPIQVRVPIEIVKEKPKKKLTTRQRVRKVIKEKMEEMS